jgi:hypothetical protein
MTTQLMLIRLCFCGKCRGVPLVFFLFDEAVKMLTANDGIGDGAPAGDDDRRGELVPQFAGETRLVVDCKV